MPNPFFIVLSARALGSVVEVLKQPPSCKDGFSFVVEDDVVKMVSSRCIITVEFSNPSAMSVFGPLPPNSEEGFHDATCSETPPARHSLG